MQQGPNIEVLSTAKIPAALIKEAAEENIRITVTPFIETEPIQTIEVQQEIEAALLQSAIVVFTSQNAVKAIAESLYEQEPDWYIYCLEGKTKQLAAAHFGEERIVGTADTAVDLAWLIVEEDNTDEVIFFCGDKRLNDLPDVLQQHGIAVNEIMVYETVAVPQKTDKEYRGVLFFSPSAVDSFFSVNHPDHDIVFFATGATTAKAIQRHTKHSVITCRQTGKEEMIREVILFFTE